MSYTTRYDPETAKSISALALRIMDTNLCKEIMLDDSSTGVFYAPYIPKIMKPKYQFSREWYEADFDTAYYGEVIAWCKEQFGPHDKNPDAWSRWNHRYEGKILFRDQKDYNWFVMRWGA
jgi:hypothetical protein